MACLPGHHHDLSTVVRLVGHEVREHVADVERQVAPDIPLRRRYLPGGREPQTEKILNPLPAAFQRSHELASPHAMMVHTVGRSQTVLAPERLDPSASAVVDMRRNHPNGAVGHVRNLGVPERGREVLNEGDVDPVVGAPGGDDRCVKIEWRRRHPLSHSHPNYRRVLRLRAGFGTRAGTWETDPSRDGRCGTSQPPGGK